MDRDAAAFQRGTKVGRGSICGVQLLTDIAQLCAHLAEMTPARHGLSVGEATALGVVSAKATCHVVLHGVMPYYAFFQSVFKLLQFFGLKVKQFGDFVTKHRHRVVAF